MINMLYNNKTATDANLKVKNYHVNLSGNTLIKGTILQKDGRHIRIQSQYNTNTIIDIVTKSNLSLRHGEILTIKKSEIETITKISDEQLEKEKEREKEYIEELKKEKIEAGDANLDAIKNLKNSEIPATKENILRFATIKESLKDFSKFIDFNILTLLIDKGYDIENMPISKLSEIVQLEKFNTDKTIVAISNLLNKDMSYDRARDISRELYKSQMGKDIHDIIIALDKNDIEITKENIDNVYDIFSKLYNLSDIDNNDIAKAVKNSEDISINLLYNVKNYVYSSKISSNNIDKYYYQEISPHFDIESDKLTEDIKNLLNELNIDIDDINIAKSILKEGKEVNIDNINEIKDIRNSLEEVQRLLDKNTAAMLIKSKIDISAMDIRSLLKEIVSLINEKDKIDVLNLNDEEIDLSINLMNSIKEIHSDTLLKNITVKSILYSSNTGKDLYDKLFSSHESHTNYSNNISLKTAIVFNAVENIDFSYIKYNEKNISLQYIANKYSLFKSKSNLKLTHLKYNVQSEIKTEIQNEIVKHYEYLRTNLRTTHISHMLASGIDPFDSDIRRVSDILRDIISKNKSYEKLLSMKEDTIDSISSDLIKSHMDVNIRNIKKSLDLQSNTVNYIDDLKFLIKEIKEKNFYQLNELSEKIEKFYIKTSNLSKNSLQDSIRSLYESLKEMENIVSSSNREDKNTFKKYLENIADNIKDSQKISSQNEMLQIPFYMNDDSSNANVFAKSKKNKKGKIDPNDMSILIELNTKKLGNMGFYIKVDNKKLSIKISGSDNFIFKIKSNLNSLDTSLNSLGYDIDNIELKSPETQSKLSFISENARDTNSKLDLFI